MDFFESGFNPTGVEADFFLPNPVPQTTLEMTVDAVRAGELGLTGGHGGSQPAWLCSWLARTAPREEEIMVNCIKPIARRSSISMPTTFPVAKPAA